MKMSKKVLAVMMAVIMTLSITVVVFSTTTASAAVPAWKTAYINFVKTHKAGGYGLVDLDKNGVPELLYHTGTYAGFGSINTYNNNKIQTRNIGGYGTLYILNNMYYVPTYHQGVYGDIVFRTNNTLQVAFDGEGIASRYDSTGGHDYTYKYRLNESSYFTSVSRSQYYNKLNSIFNKNKAKRIDLFKCYNYNQIINAINNYSSPYAPPSAPGNLRIRNYGTGFNINWNRAARAAKYRVYYKSIYSSGWSYIDTTKNYANLTYLSTGKLYYIQVRAYGANGIAGGITKVKSMTHVRDTSINSIVYNSNGTITLKWDPGYGANGYAIAKKKAGAKKYTYYYVSSRTFTDKNVAAGSRYTYQVNPFYSDGKSAAYSQWSSSRSITALYKPTITNMNINYSRLNINWNAIKGAKAYRVAFKRTYDSRWNYRTTKSRYYNVPKPTKGATYVVQVCALSGNYSSPFSKVASITNITTPNVYTFRKSSNRLNAKWYNVNGAYKYKVAYKASWESSWHYYYEYDNNFNLSSFYSNTKYYLQVSAIGYNGEQSAFSQPVSCWT